MCVYFYVTYFTSVNLCNHHCNEDAELFYHHKQLPRVTLLELPSIFHHCYVRAYICQSCFIFPFFPPFTFHCLVFLAFLWITWTLFTTPFWLICRIFKSIYLNSFWWLLWVLHFTSLSFHSLLVSIFYYFKCRKTISLYGPFTICNIIVLNVSSLFSG